MPLRARLRELVSIKKRKSSSTNTTDSRAKTPHPEEDNSVAVDIGPSQRHEPVHSGSQNEGDDVKAAPGIHVARYQTDRAPESALMVLDVATDIVSILREAAESSSVLTPLKACCSVIEKVLEAVRESSMIGVNLHSLRNHLQDHYSFIEDEIRDLGPRDSSATQEPPRDDLLNALQAYIKAISTEKRTLYATRAEIASWDQGKVGTTVQVSNKIGTIQTSELEARLDKSFHDLLRRVHSQILEASMKAENAAATLRLSQLLKGSINARGERINPLTPGTRLALIERFSEWKNSKEGTEQIFWLRDEAGTGKSALAAHMAKCWEEEGALAARFFFDRNGGRNLRRLDRFCITLAKEIADHHPLARAMYPDLLDKTPNLDDMPFPEAFRFLVISIAEQLSKRLHRPLIFVFDALDECHEDDIQVLVSSILDIPPGLSSCVRFLLTSRPTKEITSILGGISGIAGNEVVLLDVKNGEAERDRDTSIYVRNALKDFSVMDQNAVIQCASGVFLWATLACDTLLRAVTPRKVLDKFQNNAPDKTMQVLYEAALEAALPPDPSPHDVNLLRTVLQGVVLTYYPVSIFCVQTFFPGYKEETVEGEEFVEYFVKKMGSIMKDGTPFLPIYILHPTFREFIEDQKNGARFYISPPDGHCSIAVASLAILTESLTSNVLSLDDGKSPLPVGLPYEFETPARLKMDIEAPLRYAVAFWATHASLALGEEEKLQKLVNGFLLTKFLTWIEWSSAIREVSECTEGLRRLLCAISMQKPSKTNKAVETSCSHALRFLLRNNHIIERCGLQAWMSALVFTPKDSIIYKAYAQRSLRPLPVLLTYYADESFYGSRVLWDAKVPLERAIFSPDGRRLLALSRNSASLWNAKSLKCITALKTGEDLVTTESLAFSSDGLLIASGNYNSTLCLWDGVTGTLKEQLPRRHKSRVLHVEFLLSDTVIAAVDNNHLILCWNVTPTEVVRNRARKMQGEMHTGQVGALVPSPDRKIFATFSQDKSIRLWDPEKMVSIGNPMTADHFGTGLFSVDGTRIVVGYNDGVVAIWDVANQTRLYTLESGSPSVSAIAVSPDGKTIAAGDDYLCLWNIETGRALCEPLEGHVFCLSFNSSGNRLVSGSYKNHVTIWDIRSDGINAHIESVELRGHSSYVLDVSSSPSGTLITSASDDGTLRVWDTGLIECSDTDVVDLGHPHQRVKILAASKDGTRLISAWVEGIFQVWDFVTGQKIGQLFHSSEGEVITVVFSSGNMLWASSHFNRSGSNACVWEWQAEHMAPKSRTLLCEQGDVLTCVEFTEDRTRFITGGSDHSIRIWDLSNLDCIANLDCSSVPIHISVTRDGRYLVSASKDADLRVWNMDSYQLVRGPKSVKERDEWKLINDRITSLVISPDGRKIVTKHGFTIQIFDLEDALRCCAAFEKLYDLHSTPKADWEPAFSWDGRYLFYGSHYFDLSALAGEGFVRLRPQKTEGLPPSPVSPLFLNEGRGEIYSIKWDTPLLVIPADVNARVWVARDEALAFGCVDGRVFIIRFPEGYI